MNKKKNPFDRLPLLQQQSIGRCRREQRLLTTTTRRTTTRRTAHKNTTRSSSSTRNNNNNQKYPSFDSLALAMLVTGTGGSVLYSFDEGNYPLSVQVKSSDCIYHDHDHDHDDNDDHLKGQRRDDDSTSSSGISSRFDFLTPANCRQLEVEGYLVMDDFLLPSELAAAAKSAKLLEAHRRRPAAPDDDADADTADGGGAGGGGVVTFMGIRTDSIVYYNPEEYIGATETRQAGRKSTTNGEEEEGLWQVRRLLRGIGHAVEQSDFHGFEASSVLSLQNHTSTTTTTNTTNPVSAIAAAHEEEGEDSKVIEHGAADKGRTMATNTTTTTTSRSNKISYLKYHKRGGGDGGVGDLSRTTTATAAAMPSSSSSSSWLGVPETIQCSKYEAIAPQSPSSRRSRKQEQEDTLARSSSTEKDASSSSFPLTTSSNRRNKSSNNTAEDDDNNNNNSEQQQQVLLSNYNHAHRDACTQCLEEQGLLGYLGSKYLRKRYLTCIVYLNCHDDDDDDDTTDDDVDSNSNNSHKSSSRSSCHHRPWQKSDGGQLHLYLGAHPLDMTGDSILLPPIHSTPTTMTQGNNNNNNSSRNGGSSSKAQQQQQQKRLVSIEPKGGRLVLLSSEHILHQVQPTFRDRHACTIWLTLNQ